MTDASLPGFSDTKSQHGEQCPAGDKVTYAVYGLAVTRTDGFINRLHQRHATPNLTIHMMSPASGPVDGDARVLSLPASTPTDEAFTMVATSRHHLADGRPSFQLMRIADEEHFHFPAIGHFALGDDRIVIRPQAGVDLRLVEHFLLGGVLSYWLERRGTPTFHAAAAIVDGGAVGFLSSNGGGKSALAATLMQVGYPLLTDDILPLVRDGDHFAGQFGYASMRMWPDEARHFLGDFEHLDFAYAGIEKRRVDVGEPDGFGTFYPQAAPLRVLYIPERRLDGHDDGVYFEPLGAAAAVVALTQNTFITGLAKAAGFQRNRFALFTDLAQHVPVRRLSYPTGFDHLPRVVDAILADSAGLIAPG